MMRRLPLALVLVLVIQAAGDATTGQLANMVVRASMEFDGQASIDQPIAINVSE